MNDLDDGAAEWKGHGLAANDKVRPEAINRPFRAKAPAADPSSRQMAAAQGEDPQIETRSEKAPVLCLVPEAAYKALTSCPRSDGA